MRVRQPQKSNDMGISSTGSLWIKATADDRVSSGVENESGIDDGDDDDDDNWCLGY